MRIERASEMWLEQMISMANQAYAREQSRVDALCGWQADAEAMRQALPGGLVATDGDALLGYLLHRGGWSDGNRTHVSFPVWGYGARDEKTLSRLFQATAEALLRDGATRFDMNLYAHDDAAIRLFCMLQFGMECEECVRATADTLEQSDPVRELDKTEIGSRWSELWSLLAQLIDHLRRSPVFYPGREFTEALYRDYLSDPTTRVFVAEDGAAIVGMILASDERNDVLRGSDCRCVGEAFVLPAYRGGSIARSLLACVNRTLRQEGVARLWVRHGTANPNARGYWDKYFQPYSCSMIRDIEPVD